MFTKVLPIFKVIHSLICVYTDMGTHMSVCRRMSEQAHATGHVWKSEQNPQGQSLPSTTWLLVETQVNRLGSKHLYLLNHPVPP